MVMAVPKINVYLPGDLAVAVRAAGFPVSPVCQRALAEAVRSVTRARRVIESLREAELDQASFAEIGPTMTRHLSQVFELALAGRAAAAPAGTGQLLLGLLDDGANLGVRILQALDVDLDELRVTVEQVNAGQPEAGEPGAERPVSSQAAAEAASWPRALSRQARNAVASAIEAAIGLGHNYLGCEHLLLGLLAEPGSAAGRALREHEVQAADARHALTAALAGYAHGRQAPWPTDERGHDERGHDERGHDELGRRLDAVESRLTALGG